MKHLNLPLLIATILFASLFVSFADTKQEIEKANQKGQVVFLVVTEKGNSQNQAAMNLANQAKKYTKSRVIELDRGSMMNDQLVQKYRLAGAPLPLILVIATNGYVAWGARIENLTAERIALMVPSKKEEGVIKAINEGKSVFLVFSKISDAKNKKQLKACQSACSSMSDKAEIVFVDINDSKEKSFVKKFNVDKDTDLPITYVINGQGQVTSMFNGITESKDLVSAATKIVKSGCCPPGSGKSCGPTK